MKRDLLSRLRLVRTLALFAACAAAACTDHDEAIDGGGRSLTVRAVCGDMLPEVVGTRAQAEPKTEEEKQIRQLHLFIFDRDGRPLEGKTGTIRSYQYIENSVLEIPDGEFDATDARVVVIANVDKYKFTADPDAKQEGDPVLDPQYTTLEGLRRWVYVPKELREHITQLPLYGMPMASRVETVDLTGQSNRRTVEVKMEALMARVDIVVRIDADQTSRDLKRPDLNIVQWDVHNMLAAVPFDQPAERSDTTLGKRLHRRVVQDESGKHIHHGDGELTFRFYTYENIQQPAAGPDPYPDNIEEEDKQRWKPNLVRRDHKWENEEIVHATALTFTGDYITHQGLNYRAKFTIYIGDNAIDNFEVRRNHRYKYNVTIHGLDYVRNSDDQRYTFDGRIDVQSDNAVYVSIVNERKLDAHYAVLPMDLFFLKAVEGSEVDVSLVNPDMRYEDGTVAPWARLAHVSGADMAAQGYKAGTGAEKFFYEGLLDDLSARAGGGRSCTIRCERNASGEFDRDRIYFYIDENLTDADRLLEVDIVYRSPDGSSRRRRLEIEQKHLLPVAGLYVENAGGSREQWYYKNFFIEYYEEYRDHQDPLELHNDPSSIYPGLEWGLSGFDLGTDRSLVRFNNADGGRARPGRAYYYYANAYANTYLNGATKTEEIVERMKSEDAAKYGMENCPNYSVPPSAAHYCYMKNKRASAGSLGSVHKSSRIADMTDSFWYLPGISGLESLLMEYHTLFPQFQQDHYWSAAAGKFSYGITAYENPFYARATKVSDTPTAADRSDRYVPNGTDDNAWYPGGGKAQRTEVLRIRAAYGNRSASQTGTAVTGTQSETHAREVALQNMPSLPSAEYGLYENGVFSIR